MTEQIKIYQMNTEQLGVIDYELNTLPYNWEARIITSYRGARRASYINPKYNEFSFYEPYNVYYCRDILVVHIDRHNKQRILTKDDILELLKTPLTPQYHQRGQKPQSHRTQPCRTRKHNPSYHMRKQLDICKDEGLPTHKVYDYDDWDGITTIGHERHKHHTQHNSTGWKSSTKDAKQWMHRLK